MEIILHHEQNVHFFQLVLEDKMYYYREYLDNKGKLIGSELYDEDNNPIYDKRMINRISDQISY